MQSSEQPAGDSVRDNQPLSKVQWVHRDKLRANDYNPNAVAPPELKLLKISIMEDGWTQPIVVNPDWEIVDGFHRWTVSGHEDMVNVFGGYVPVVMTRPKDRASQKMATIRHNRARGTHSVVKMGEIVASMINDEIPLQEICERLKMEDEEVFRLANSQGIPKDRIIVDEDYSAGWTPG